MNIYCESMVKSVNNNIVLTLFIVVWCTCAYGQEKYLLFDAKKDSVIELEGIEYFKIDGNLFDIDRNSQIDTISSNLFINIEFTSVKNLRKRGNEITDSYFKNLKDNEPILVEKAGIETRNDLFKYIYVLVKVNDCSYKRTRVWWIDY